MAEQLTERQKKWFASVQAGLERDTGKSLAEWVAIARTCPETGRRKQTEWLKELHGLGVNRAAQILHEAFPEALGWDDSEGLRATLWKDPASLAIFKKLEAVVQDFEGLVTGQRKGFSAWSRNFQFAAVRPIKGGKARLGLCVTPTADARLEPYKNEGWSERLKAAVTLCSPDEVDALIVKLLKASWNAS